MKFAILLKSNLLLAVSFLFSVYKQTLRLNKKTRTTMNAKVSVCVICVKAIIYLLLLNMHDFTFKMLHKRVLY